MLTREARVFFRFFYYSRLVRSRSTLVFGMTEQGMDRNNSRVLPQLGDGKDVVFESEASEGGGGGRAS